MSTSINDDLMSGGKLQAALFSTDASGNVTGLVGPDGLVLIGGALTPTGNDQASEIEEYINDLAGTQVPTLAGGDFIIGSPLTLYSRLNYGNKWGNKGIGLALRGAGPELTRILYTGSKDSPMFLVTDPGSTSPAINARNTMVDFGGMSLLSATTGGAEQEAGTVAGSCIECRPYSGTGTVVHQIRFHDMRLDGWAYGISLDDVTNAVIERCWFQEFTNAVRLGYNIDILEICNSAFGLEQFQSGSERNSAIAVKTGWDTVANTPGNSNNILLKQNWFMGIGAAVDLGANEGQIHLLHNYFERCLQYYKTTAGSVGSLIFDSNTFSLPGTNDSAAAKIDLGTAGNSRLEFKNNLASSGTPTNSWISFTGFNTLIRWSKNYMLGSHIKYADATNPRTITLPNNGVGEHVLGGTYGVQQTSGESRQVERAGTGTITCNWYDGDTNNFATQTGNMTIYMAASATPPSQGVRIKFRVKAAASNPDTYSITWDSGWKFPFTWAAPTSADANKQSLLEVERVANGWMVISPQNVWL